LLGVVVEVEVELDVAAGELEDPPEEEAW
jgi:hypothetical protein